MTMAETPGAPAGGYPPPRPIALGRLAPAAMASIGAGAIHAAAVGVHSEHRQAVVAFAALGLAQVVWGTVALIRSGRAVAAAGVALGAGALAGWVAAKTVGLGFIDGLEEVEGIGWADGLAALLAAFAGLASLRGLLAHRVPPPPRRRWAMGALSSGLIAIALLGMTAAGSHTHADGEGHSHGAGEAATGGEAEPHSHGTGTAALPAKPYDPTKPIDLSGVAGVSPEQQARAENLIAITLIRLPHFADYRTAEAEGYHSIGDAFTGAEHFINWQAIDDDHVLDPDHPESLVYEPQPDGSKKLVSAMYMLKRGTTLDDVPDIGGSLTQWHIHDNLCFSKDPTAPRVAGITDANGGCPSGLQKFTPVPMIHVWIVPHPCGPFAALEGVGAGQIAEGEERLCDHVHGAGG